VTCHHAPLCHHLVRTVSCLVLAVRPSHPRAWMWEPLEYYERMLIQELKRIIKEAGVSRSEKAL
jgi:hypothetical protein